MKSVIALLLVSSAAMAADPVEVRVVPQNVIISRERAHVEANRRLGYHTAIENAKIRAQRQREAMVKLGALDVAEMKEWRKLDGDESKALMAFQRNGKAEDRDKAIKALLRKVELLTKEETAAK